MEKFFLVTLFHILQGFVTFLAGTDFYHVLNVIHKDLAVANMACIQHFLCSLDHRADRHLAHDHVNLHLGQQGGFHLDATVILRLALLYAAAHDVGHGHAGDANIHHSFLQRLKTGLLADDFHLGKLGSIIGEGRHLLHGNCLSSRHIAGHLHGSRSRSILVQSGGIGQHGISSIRGEQAMLGNIQTDQFVFGISTQADGVLDELEHDGDDHCHISSHRNYAQELDAKQKYNMIADIEKVDGVKQVLGLESIIGPAFPEGMIPENVKEILESDNYELMLIMNEYAVASDEVNSQLSEINTILKQYDPTGMLVGEAPCTKDLIEITNHDFAVVSAVSILAVFFIIFFVFKSISLPVILVMVIEGAIFINMGIPFLTGTKLPFIASIVIGTIQLGATVDYAILITSRYEKERGEGKSKKDAIQIAHKTSIRPVMVSAFSFFAATFGVGMYSQIDMISSLCLLMARGALISMCAVLLFLPAMFWLFDGIICKTSLNFRRKH